MNEEEQYAQYEYEIYKLFGILPKDLEQMELFTINYWLKKKLEEKHKTKINNILNNGSRN